MLEAEREQDAVEALPPAPPGLLQAVDGLDKLPDERAPGRPNVAAPVDRRKADVERVVRGRSRFACKYTVLT